MPEVYGLAPCLSREARAKCHPGGVRENVIQDGLLATIGFYNPVEGALDAEVALSSISDASSATSFSF